jgi:tetratricopeptide (TPR) repeat protein
MNEKPSRYAIPPERSYTPKKIWDAKHQDHYFSLPLQPGPDSFSMRSPTNELFSPIFHSLFQQDQAAAVQAAKHLYEIKPDDMRTGPEFARQLVAAGKPEEAIAVLEEVLKSGTTNMLALSLLAYAKLQTGASADALTLFTEAVTRTPSDAFAHINRNFLLKQRRKDKPPAVSDSPSVCVATSLPPRNLEDSRRAVDSWLAQGFSVVSLNTEAEYALLAPHFPGIRFCINERTAKELVGKDYQYLDALLDCLAPESAEVHAIINADIVLQGGLEVWTNVARRASIGFVFGSRVNVEDLQDTSGMLYVSGFDWFFFSCRL